MARKIPLRQCIGCGEMKGKKEMLRVLRTQEEEIILDSTGRKNGRGAYICPNPECMRKARKSKALDRAFKMAVSDNVYDSLTKEIELFE
jgi:predicted RNA-binding protein YlxR (DUF448 family)